MTIEYVKKRNINGLDIWTVADRARSAKGEPIGWFGFWSPNKPTIASKGEMVGFPEPLFNTPEEAHQTAYKMAEKKITSNV